MDDTLQKARDWWRTDIIHVEPGRIDIRGYPIAELIGQLTFPQMIWLMLRGEVPSQEQARLLEASLVASVDHGPQAPSIAIARMAMTCGVGINNAMATAANVLGDVHGGAGEQLMEIFADIDALRLSGVTIERAVAETVDRYRAQVGKYLPGYGHRFHPHDPRSDVLLGLVGEAAGTGVVTGRHLAAAQAIKQYIDDKTGRSVPINIDGCSAVILAELGFAPMLGRALFVLARSVGIMAHAWEQSQQGGRNKGPIPKEFLYSYTGVPRRHYEPEA